MRVHAADPPVAAVTVAVAARAPARVGVNVITNVQVAFGARIAVQLFALDTKSAGFAPATARAGTLEGVAPSFLTVKVMGALDAATATIPKS